MESGEARILLRLLVVVGARVDGAVEVAEQLGQRLDALIGDAARPVERLGLGEVARLDRIGEGGRVLEEHADLVDDVELVLRDRLDELHRVGLRKGPRYAEEERGRCRPCHHNPAHFRSPLC